MKINVARLRRTEGGTERFEFSESIPALKLGADEYVFLSPLHVMLDVTNSGKSLLVNGTVSSVIKAVCSRCLKEFSHDLSIQLEDEWVPVEFSSEEHEDTALIFDKDEFCLDERILEHIVVQLPMRFTCTEECQGLCPKCGIDRNQNQCSCADEVIDPRLEILSKWNKGV